MLNLNAYCAVEVMTLAANPLTSVKRKQARQYNAFGSMTGPRMQVMISEGYKALFTEKVE